MKIFAWCLLKRDFTSGVDETERTFDRLAEVGIDGLLPFVYEGGMCWYDSAIPGAKKEDRLSPVLDLAHARGIEVHPLILPLQRVTPLEEAERRRQSYQSGQPGGNPCDGRRCASWDENLDNGVVMTEDVLARHPVDGIHLDAIRYVDTGQSLKWPCRCEACSAYYRTHMGKAYLTVEDLAEPDVHEQFLAFRGQRIRGLMERIVDIVKPRGIPLSLAARANYHNAALVEGQDWIAWSKAGWLDFVCPMNYSTNREVHRDRLSAQMDLLAGAVPVYDGIGRKSSAGEMSPEEMVVQAEDALALGAEGIAIFHFTALEEADFEALEAFRHRTTSG